MSHPIQSEAHLTTFEAISMIVGNSIGTGIIAVPYLATKNSMLDVVWMVLIAYCVNVILHLIIAELSYNNGGVQLVKSFEGELFHGKMKQIFSWSVFIVYGLAIMIGVSGNINGGAQIFVNWFGMPFVAAQVLYYVIAGVVVFIGMKAVKILYKHTYYKQWRNFVMAKEIKKVVLAYSGGLDTSIIIPWLKENYNNCEVIAVSGNVGQGTELDGLEEKAIKTGASKLYIEDLTEEFIEDYVYPTVQAGAVYENQYLLGTSFARPIIAKRIAEIAIKEGADAICHGCTGKGNDQVRFELAIKAFAPDMEIIAPWRIWDLKSREQEIEYAEAHNIPLKINRETNYSKDKNLWHLSHEGLDLEDPANEPQYEKPGFLEMGVSPIMAPDKPTYVTIHFEKGIPTAVDGVEMNGKELVTKLNELGGANGIGLADLVENRLVGMKSRGVYETPGGAILYKAHEVLETITLDKETARVKQYLSIKFADIVYNGQWFTPLREAMSAFVTETQKTVTGDVKLKLYKGNMINAGVTSPYTLYDEEVATFDEDNVYNQADSAGFINLFGLPIKVRAKLEQKRNAKKD